jgi:hypothetical protein
MITEHPRHMWPRMFRDHESGAVAGVDPHAFDL